MSGLQPSPISMACADFMKHAEKDILGMCFQFGRKRMEIEAISSFTTSILFKADHTPCHRSRFWLCCWRYEWDNPGRGLNHPHCG